VFRGFVALHAPAIATDQPNRMRADRAARLQDTSIATDNYRRAICRSSRVRKREARIHRCASARRYFRDLIGRVRVSTVSNLIDNLMSLPRPAAPHGISVVRLRFYRHRNFSHGVQVRTAEGKGTSCPLAGLFDSLRGISRIAVHPVRSFATKMSSRGRGGGRGKGEGGREDGEVDSELARVLSGRRANPTNPASADSVFFRETCHGGTMDPFRFSATTAKPPS